MADPLRIYRGPDAEFTEVRLAYAPSLPPQSWREQLGSAHYNIEGEICNCTFYRSPPIVQKMAGKLEWLQGRPDMQKPESQLLLQYFTKLVEQNPKLDALLPWLAREVKKGRLHFQPGGDYQAHLSIVRPGAVNGETGYVEVFPGTLQHIADWYADKRAPNRQGVDLMQHTFDEIYGPKIREYDQWLEEQKADADASNAAQAPIVHDFGGGWTLRRLRPEDLEYEGAAMGHCVGGYGSAVASGSSLIYSLRDAKHEPHATIEMEPGDDPEISEDGYESSPNGGRLIQIQGKGNKIPKPEYQQMLKQWFETFPIEERPFWEGEEDLHHPDQLREDGNFEVPEEGLYGNGGYGPHGDYGVEVKTGIDYAEMLKSTLPSAGSRYGETADKLGLHAIYEAARKREEVPHLADVAKHFGQEQQENFDDWREQNYMMTIPLPDEDLHEYPLTLPNGETVNNYEEHEKAYYDDERSWANDHPGIVASSYMYQLLHPHWSGDQAGNGAYVNQVVKNPTEAVRQSFGEDVPQQWVHPAQPEWDQMQAQGRTAMANGVFYHVAPAKYREQIQRQGLVPSNEAPVSPWTDERSKWKKQIDQPPGV